MTVSYRKNQYRPEEKEDQSKYLSSFYLLVSTESGTKPEKTSWTLVFLAGETRFAI